MTIKKGRDMFKSRGRKPEATAADVASSPLARGRALFSAANDPNTGRRSAARAVLDEAAALAAAGTGAA